MTPYFSGALAIFLLRHFFRALPTTLIEAAWLDGAGIWRILRRVVILLSRNQSQFTLSSVWSSIRACTSLPTTT